MTLKVKIDQLNTIKAKNHCTLKKKSVKKMKRQTTDYYTALAKNIFDKGLESRIYNELLELNKNFF